VGRAIADAAAFLPPRAALSRFLTECCLILRGFAFIARVIFMLQGLLRFLRRRLDR
jgi:hypothetical protein